MEELLEVYRNMLAYAGMTSDNEGFIYTVIADHKENALLDGKQLVLPTLEQMRSLSKDTKVVFHPLWESVMERESVVLSKYRDVLNVRLNYTFAIVAASLLRISYSHEYHKRMNADQLELLIALNGADEKTESDFIDIMRLNSGDYANNLFVNIYLKHGGSVNKKRFARTGITSFPVYDSLKRISSGEEDTKFTKLDKLRKADYPILMKLYQFIFSKIDDLQAYDVGSDSSVAPYVDSLMMTSVRLASRLNDILIEYEEFIDDAPRLMFDAKWMEAFGDLDNLQKAIRTVPQQAGNEGRSKIDDAVRAAQSARNAEINPSLSVPVPAPVGNGRVIPPAAPVVQTVPYHPSVTPPLTTPVVTPSANSVTGTASFNDLRSKLFPPPGSNQPSMQQRRPSWAAGGQGGVLNNGNGGIGIGAQRVGGVNTNI